MSNTLSGWGNADDGEVDLFDGSWRKSSFSGSNGDCVEVAVVASAQVGVRDSKATTGPHLRFRPNVWAAFLANLQGLPSAGRNLIR